MPVDHRYDTLRHATENWRSVVRRKGVVQIERLMVPLGFVSFAENLMMVAMAIWMLAKPALIGKY